MTPEQEYLEAIRQELLLYADKIKELQGSESEIGQNMTALLAELAEVETHLRTTHQIGARFTVLKSQIDLLLQQCYEAFSKVETPKTSTETSPFALAEDEMLVFIYLFNMHGDKIKNWQKLLTIESLKDHAVNRPIYTTRNEVEELLRSKQDQALHGYLEVAMKKQDVLPSASRDAQGHSLVRLKENSLKLQNVRYFVHLGKSYRIMNEFGELA